MGKRIKYVYLVRLYATFMTDGAYYWLCENDDDSHIWKIIEGNPNQYTAETEALDDLKEAESVAAAMSSQIKDEDYSGRCLRKVYSIEISRMSLKNFMLGIWAKTMIISRNTLYWPNKAWKGGE